jgi:hypothetical protein
MWHRLQKRRAEQLHLLQHDEDTMDLMAIAGLVDEEDEPHRGSVVGREVTYRDRYGGYHRLMQDYFVASPVYNEKFFRRR